MARMGREFSLVLLGSSILTTGYFLLQEGEDVAAKEEEQVRQQAASTNGHRYGGMLFFYHAGAYSNARTSPAYSGSVASRGFGGIGRVSSGG